MHTEAFTPLSALVGGVLIGLGASLYLLLNGRVAGVSGLLTAFFGRQEEGRRVRLLFLAGLVVAAVVASFVTPGRIEASTRSLPLLALSGVLVGVGTRLANGCTSGHGICGISRGSKASIMATATFVAVGAATATLMTLLGAAP